MSGRRCSDCGGAGSVSVAQRRSQELLAALCRAECRGPVSCVRRGRLPFLSRRKAQVDTIKADAIRDLL